MSILLYIPIKLNFFRRIDNSQLYATAEKVRSG